MPRHYCLAAVAERRAGAMRRNDRALSRESRSRIFLRRRASRADEMPRRIGWLRRRSRRPVLSVTALSLRRLFTRLDAEALRRLTALVDVPHTRVGCLDVAAE